MNKFKIQMKKIIRYLFSTVNQSDRQRFNSVTDWWSPSSGMMALQSYNYLRVEFIHEMLNLPQKLYSLEGIKALDVGVGGGILSESLRRLGADVTGIDVSEQSIATAEHHKSLDPSLRHDNKLQYVLNSPESLPDSYGNFDLITAMEVIEHVQNPQIFVDALAKRLNPNGLLFFSTINRTYEAYVKLILGAEYITRIVPVGTHDWNLFKTPEELWLYLTKNHLKIKSLRGVEYDLITGAMNYSDNQTQYILCCSK